MTAFELRPFELADREHVYQLEREAFRDYVERLLGGWDEADQRARFDRRFEGAMTEMITVAGETVGFVQLEVDPPGLRICNVVIADGWRGRGIGSAVIGLVAARTAGPLRLRVFQANPAVALYRRLGFRVVGEDQVHWFQMERSPDALGLANDAVQLVDHQAAWAVAFDAARARITAALDPALIVALEHVGSTSVPGLVAKPIIDIALEIPAGAATPIAPLVAAGYLDRGDKGADGGHLFGLEPEPGIRTEHLHVVRAGDGLLAIYLRFRDRLRADPDARRRYAELKRRLAAELGDQRERYTDSKADFIRAMLG